MRAQLQSGQSPGGRGGTVTASICILLVAQSCAAQTSPAPGTIRGTVADSFGSVVEAAIVRLQAAGATALRTTLNVLQIPPRRRKLLGGGDLYGNSAINTIRSAIRRTTYPSTALAWAVAHRRHR
jgi:hypothetical protein